MGKTEGEGEKGKMESYIVLFSLLKKKKKWCLDVILTKYGQ